MSEVALEHTLEPRRAVHLSSGSWVFADAGGRTDSCGGCSQPAAAKGIGFVGAGRIDGADLNSSRVLTPGFSYGVPGAAPSDEQTRPSAGVLPHSRHGKCLRRCARLTCCTGVFCVLLGGVICLEAVLTATDASPLAPGSNASEPAPDAPSPRERKTVRTKLDMIVVTSWSALGLLLLVGHLARRYSRLLRALHLPASVVGGILGWAFFGVCDVAGAGALMEEWFSIGWDVLPGFCTNIVFCCLFLGTPVPRAAEVLASPRKEQLLYGLVVVFGQYATSCLITMACQLWDPSLRAPFATVMPFGYAGGPVVAEAMKDLYAPDSFGYPDGYPLALLAATVGMFVGVIAGAVLVNLAPLGIGLGGAAAARAEEAPGRQARCHRGGGGGGGAVVGTPIQTERPRGSLMKRLKKSMKDLAATAPDSDHFSAAARLQLPSAQQTVSVESLDSLTFHLCLVSLTLFGGYLLRIPVVLMEQLFPTGSFWEKSNLLSVLPLFLFCLLAGLLMQSAVDTFLTDKATGHSFIDRETVVRVSNTAQDILIVTAIARLGRNGLPEGVVGLGPFFGVVARSGLPFLLVCAGGLVWGLVAFWALAPRMLPDLWAERALVEFGVSIGATSTGMLLLRMADPDNATPVLRDFTFKQIFHVLITGGGFFDVLVPIPLTAASGSCIPLLLTVLTLTGVCLLLHPGAQRRARALLPGSIGAPVLGRTATARTAEMALAVETVRGANWPAEDRQASAPAVGHGGDGAGQSSGRGGGGTDAATHRSAGQAQSVGEGTVPHAGGASDDASPDLPPWNAQSGEWY